MRTFRGGIHPPGFKFPTRDKGIRPARLPEKVVIPLSQHTGGLCKPTVKVKDKVDVGTKVGESAGFISSPVHSSISGVVTKIDNFPHPVIGRCLSVTVESDGQNRLDPSIKRRPEGPPPFPSASKDISGERTNFSTGPPLKGPKGEGERGEAVSPQDLEVEPDQIRKAALVCGVVGMGGAAFPTHVKLTPPKGKTINALILNGAECEPYISCDHRLMLERSDEILAGARLIMRALGVNRCYLGIESNKPDAIRAMRQAAKRLFPHPVSHRREDAQKGSGSAVQQAGTYWPQGGEGRGEAGKAGVRAPAKIEIVSLKTKYPQGAEKQLIKVILNKEVPPAGLPFDVGVVVQNVGTALALYEAVVFNKPLYERVITVAGKCIREPANLLARIGTSIADLIEDCGGLVEEPAKIVVGGPLMGIAQYTEEAPVIKGTSGILFLSQREAEVEEEGPCIRCGKCVDVCPVNLIPTYIARLVKKQRWKESEGFNIADCIECGACAYECPSKISLVQLIKLGKSKLRKAK